MIRSLRTVTTKGGVALTRCRLGASPAASGAAPSDAPILLLCHATGFCKEVWEPVVEELAHLLAEGKGGGDAPMAAASRALDGAEIVALDFSGHGDTPAARAESVALDWGQFTAADVFEALHEAGVEAGGAGAGAGASRPVLGVGHSMGGAAVALAELARPGTFSGALLLEPILFPSGFPTGDYRPGSSRDHPL